MSVLAVTASIFVAIFVVILGKFIDVLIAPRTFNSLFRPSSSVKDLEAATDALRAAKKDIDEKIADAERQSKIPTSQVEGWKKRVDNILADIEGVVNKYNRCRDKRAFSYIYSMYSVATECAQYHQRVKDLLEERSVITVATESDSKDKFATAYEVPGSLELNYEKVLEFVKPDKSVNVIGIWGMGGVGKTTLLKKIYNFCRGLWYFDHVIWITASREHSNVSWLQSEIVKDLRLNENDEPQSQARSINSYLINKKFILFIDDLGEAVDLTEVGVPDISNTDCCIRKVVFTTRELYVCRNMDTKEIIDMKCLNHAQSLILFKKKVGERIIQSHPLISKLAEDVAKECKGLPLALIIVGRAMSTRSNVDDWKSTLDLLKNSHGHQVLGVDEKLLHTLKISYDYLKTDQLRECFLTISMWPEDHMIATRELIQFWMGMNLIDNFESKHDIYRDGRLLIRSLQDACLLEDAGNSYFVKMHDVLRDLALWLASDCGKNKNKWMVKAAMRLQKATNMKAKWKEAKYISLMDNIIKEWPSDIPNCPSLVTLLLQRNGLSDEYKLNCFDRFQFLTHLNLSENCLESFPESICGLTELQYLNLSSNNITNLPMKLRNLKVLRYLILRDNQIINIARGVFAELAELLVLDMYRAIDNSENIVVDVEELKCIENKLLSFGTNVKTEEELRKLMLLSGLPIDDLCIQGLLHTTTFHFMSVIRNPHRLMNLHIERCSDDLMEIVFDENESRRTNVETASLNLKLLLLDGLDGLKRIIWKDIAPEILFVELRTVVIQRCACVEDITWVVHLPSLEYLFIKACESIRIAINNDVDQHVLTFPSLEEFRLISLDKLEKISTHSLALPQLKEMSIIECPVLKALPLEVKTTPILRKIKGEKEWWEKVEWKDDNSTSHFNQFFKPY